MKKHAYFFVIGSVILFITSLIAIFICAYFLDVYHPLWDALFQYGLIVLPISIVVFLVNIFFLEYNILEYREKKEIVSKRIEMQKKQQAEARKLQAKLDILIKEKKDSDETLEG